MSQPLAVRWPDHYAPRNCSVHVRNELAMDAPLNRVWAWLVHATLWPTWYSNSAHVRILIGTGPELMKGTCFRWETFGLSVTSTVLEYVPRERLAWDAHAVGIDTYHAWVMQPSPEAGCHVLTEVTQHGWLAGLTQRLKPNRISERHQLWLEKLEAQARSGLPQSHGAASSARF